jgi:alpha-beta hydrolase superfamily lysophospholipase
MIVFGQSLGGAVAVSLAHRYPELVSGVILENTFKSISSMVDIMMPYLKTLKAYVLNIKWNSDEKIDQLTMPLLFISGNSMMLTTVIENLRIQCH